MIGYREEYQMNHTDEGGVGGGYEKDGQTVILFYLF